MNEKAKFVFIRSLWSFHSLEEVMLEVGFGIPIFCNKEYLCVSTKCTLGLSSIALSISLLPPTKRNIFKNEHLYFTLVTTSLKLVQNTSLVFVTVESELSSCCPEACETSMVDCEPSATTVVVTKNLFILIIIRSYRYTSPCGWRRSSVVRESQTRVLFFRESSYFGSSYLSRSFFLFSLNIVSITSAPNNVMEICNYWTRFKYFFPPLGILATNGSLCCFKT